MNTNDTITNNKKPLLPVKSDFVFKRIFGDQRNVDVLADFLKSVLDIPDEEYESITVIDPHIKKESKNDKYGILDVKVHTKSKQVIHIEIQLKVFDEIKARTIYGQSKLITEQMSSGKNYAIIKRVVTIVITDEIFIHDSNRYHHQFRHRTADGIEFTNLVETNALELPKLPPDTDKSDLWYWMKFIKSDDEEALDMLAQKSPQMMKAVGVLKELSADEQERMLYEAREMARMDGEALMNQARREGIEERNSEIARKLLLRNRPVEEIMEDTGLTLEEIKAIQSTI